MDEYVVTDESKLSEGDRIIVEIAGREIAVFNIDGEYYAYLNWCVHQCGPCCEGSLTGTVDASFDTEKLELTTEWTRDGKILNCPWHGWEYDVVTGECLSHDGVQLPSYPTRTEGGKVFVSI